MRTAEAALDGHPDMVADIIADTIVDAFLAKDKHARVGCEVLVGKDLVTIGGEFTSAAEPDLVRIAKGAIENIGYISKEMGFCADACEVVTSISPQSAPLASVVDRSRGVQMGAGDQAVVIGYAERNEAGMIPMEMYYARILANKLREMRMTKQIPYLWPDGKILVCLYPPTPKGSRVHTLCITAQHDPGVTAGRVRRDILDGVVPQCFPPGFIDNHTQVIVNPPSGLFSVGGPAADTGVTGRKCISSTYGPAVPYGGGALSGKDPSKIDRCGAYGTRFVAKNLVRRGVADRVKIEVSYVLGRPEPISLIALGWKQGQRNASDLSQMVTAEFDFKPAALIELLHLDQPVYALSASLGHFGIDNSLPWEEVDDSGVANG